MSDHDPDTDNRDGPGFGDGVGGPERPEYGRELPEVPGGDFAGGPAPLWPAAAGAGPAWPAAADGPPAWSGRPWPDRTGAGTFVPMPWPPQEPTSAPRRRLRRWLAATSAVLIVAAAGGLGYLAYRNDQSARKWRDLEQAQAARAAALTAQLRTANARIVTLNSQVGSLNAEAGTLQNQLSSVADQKEKAVDRETVLHQLLAAAGTVADDLQQCITATNQFDSDLNAAVNSGQLSQVSALQQEAAQVDGTCNQAESANQQLQSAISGAP